MNFHYLYIMNVRKNLTLPTMEYYITHLSIINTVIPQRLRITPREIDVLASFLTIPTSSRFTSHGRKTVRDMLSLSQSSLSNHIKSLISKKFILSSPDDDTTPIDVASNIIPTPTQEYHIKITHDASLPETIQLAPAYEEETHNLNNTIYERKEEEQESINNY